MRFVAAGASHGLVAVLAREAGVEVQGSFGAVGTQLEKFLGGEPCDVVILTDVQIAGLVSQGRVAAACADLGSVPTSIAVRAGEVLPDVSNEERLRAALLAADAIYFPDPSKATAGIHFAKVIDRLGIRAQVEARVKTYPNGATAMREMAAASGHPIGCTQSTEILATAGVVMVQPLPRGFDLETVYTAAVNAKSGEAQAAAAFVARLASEGARAARVRAGFRGHSIRPATSADAPSIRGIVNGILAEYHLSADPSGTDADLADLDAAYFARGGAFDVVVAVDGRIAGCCGVYALEGTTCELRKMYLVKEARGQGLGGRLLRRAIAFARGHGYRRIELETAAVLKEAIALYAGAGFHKVERAPHACRCDQVFALDL